MKTLPQRMDGRHGSSFKRTRPQWSFVNWEMPEMNGVELVQRIRESDSTGYVYIVMLTGRSEKQDIVAGMEAGAR